MGSNQVHDGRRETISRGSFFAANFVKIKGRSVDLFSASFNSFYDDIKPHDSEMKAQTRISCPNASP